MGAYPNNTSAFMRTNALVTGFAKTGNKVDFICIGENKEIKINENERIICVGNIKIIDSIKRYKKSDNGLKSQIFRFLRQVYYKLSIFDYTYKIAKSISTNGLHSNYDLMISSSDPVTSHIAAERLLHKGIKCNQWIQYWGDPFADDLTRESIYPKVFIKSIERRILSRSDKIIYVSPFTLKQQKINFKKQAYKMHFYPVPYEKEKIYPPTNNTIPILGYFGAYLSNVRNIKPLYNVVNKQKEWKLIIQGNSDLVLKERENIKIYERTSDLIGEELVDIFVCILNKYGTQIPGKLYHYAATNRPILVICDGEEKEKLKKYIYNFKGRYYVCDNNELSIAMKIRDIIKENKTFHPFKNFSAKYVANEILGLQENSEYV